MLFYQKIIEKKDIRKKLKIQKEIKKNRNQKFKNSELASKYLASRLGWDGILGRSALSAPPTLVLDSSGFPQSKNQRMLLVCYMMSKPMIPYGVVLCPGPGNAHEPPDAGTRARPALAVGILQG